MVVFVCFLQVGVYKSNHDKIKVWLQFRQDVTEESVAKAASLVTKLKLSEDEKSEQQNSKRQTIGSIAGDILIIPQATLGGKLKGSSVQYHQNIKPSEGEKYYQQFCDQIQQSHCQGGDDVGVKCGVWGARQVLSMDTNGPFSHVFDI